VLTRMRSTLFLVATCDVISSTAMVGSIVLQQLFRSAPNFPAPIASHAHVVGGICLYALSRLDNGLPRFPGCAPRHPRKHLSDSRQSVVEQFLLQREL
jgi:hypothetical protein